MITLIIAMLDCKYQSFNPEGVYGIAAGLDFVGMTFTLVALELFIKG